jgi:hypothetical protein
MEIVYAEYYAFVGPTHINIHLNRQALRRHPTYREYFLSSAVACHNRNHNSVESRQALFQLEVEEGEDKESDVVVVVLK